MIPHFMAYHLSQDQALHHMESDGAVHETANLAGPMNPLIVSGKVSKGWPFFKG
jgi:hypothetical protein